MNTDAHLEVRLRIARDRHIQRQRLAVRGHHLLELAPNPLPQSPAHGNPSTSDTMLKCAVSPGAYVLLVRDNLHCCEILPPHSASPAAHHPQPARIAAPRVAPASSQSPQSPSLPASLRRNRRLVALPSASVVTSAQAPAVVSVLPSTTSAAPARTCTLRLHRLIVIVHRRHVELRLRTLLHRIARRLHVDAKTPVRRQKSPSAQ